jgi:hypothetical protein
MAQQKKAARIRILTALGSNEISDQFHAVVVAFIAALGAEFPAMFTAIRR